MVLRSSRELKIRLYRGRVLIRRVGGVLERCGGRIRTIRMDMLKHCGREKFRRSLVRGGQRKNKGDKDEEPRLGHLGLLNRDKTMTYLQSFPSLLPTPHLSLPSGIRLILAFCTTKHSFYRIHFLLPEDVALCHWIACPSVSQLSMHMIMIWDVIQAAQTSHQERPTLKYNCAKTKMWLAGKVPESSKTQPWYHGIPTSTWKDKAAMFLD